jgi:Carboxypeptidase regulatory-like domain/TonB dependent receptor-like, beta-barrel
MKSKILSTLLLSLCCGLTSLMAQAVGGSIRGQVADPSGGALIGARVKVTEQTTGLARTTLTNAQGAYVAAALPAGVYDLEAEQTGFKKLRQSGLTLAVGEQLQADLTLQVGDNSEEITVTAEIPPLQAESAAVGVAIPNHYIVNLPLDGRNFLELVLLAPGVTPSAQGSAGSARGRLAFQTAGAREDSNAYSYDGVYAIDPVLNSFTHTPPVDAIREFRVQTTNSEAGFGRNSGGQVSVALRQGGNAFHGSVYEFLRNDKVDARNFFDDPSLANPKLRRNQFGSAVGGPIRRNSTFFFGDFESLRERRGITRTTNVPTAAERQGDFSQSALPPPIDFTTFQPFPNAQLPFVHPIGSAIANLYPLPNRAQTGQNFVASPAQVDDTNKFDARLDQRLGAGGLLSGRYSFADRDLFEPYATGSSSQIPGYGNNVAERGQNLMLGETHTLGLRWVNEFRFGYNRVDNTTHQQNLGRSVNQTVGLPDFASRERDLGLSNISITGFSPLGDEQNNPQESVADSYQLQDTASFQQGNHFVEMGFDHRWISQDAFRDVQSRGQINFSNAAYTQNALADLLLGLPTYTGGAVSDNPQALRTHATNLFLQDRWRPHRDLTLTLGLRYELNEPAYDKFNAATLYDPATMSIVPVGQGGVPRGGYEADRNNFAPRLGLAWRPFGARRAVVRAGYGVYHDLAPLAPAQGIYFNPPYFNFQLYFPSQQAPITIDNPWPAASQAPYPPSAVTYDRAFRTSYTQQWNFTTQFELHRDIVLEAGYQGTKGVKLIGARDINQPAPSPQMPNLRPLPFFQDINQTESSFNSIYHSLRWQLQCRLQGGLTGLFSYTWSKSIDNASNYFPSAVDANFPQNSNNVAAERALSNFDMRQRFSGSFVYELPFGEGRHYGKNLQGLAKALSSGWEMNGIITLQTGQPFTVALPAELDNSNTGFTILGFGAGDRPNVIGNPRLANPGPQMWFDTAAFALPPFGTFGDAGRNVLPGPSLRNMNLSLLKDNKLGDKATLQFRAEMFNVFNTPNFEQPNIFLGTPGFGRILSARDGREIQFGLKLLF